LQKSEEDRGVCHRELVEVLGLKLGQDSCLDGVARRVEEGLRDLVPLPFHLWLIIYVNTDEVLVDPEQVDHRMVLVYKDPWALGDLRGG
jgi:hypothetical protein